MFRVSADWKRAYPGAHVGILAMRNVINPSRHPELDQQKENSKPISVPCSKSLTL